MRPELTRYERAWLSLGERKPERRNRGAGQRVSGSREQLPILQPLTQFVDVRAVRLALGVSQTTLYRMRREKIFPEPVQISKGRVGWLRSVVEHWIAERSAG